MKWVLSHQSSGQHRWMLQNADAPAEFIYSLQYHSIRIKAKTVRLFFLEEAGSFFQKKILLRSEYGVVMGETQATHTTKGGTLLLNEEKFFYRWNDGGLRLLDRHKKAVSEMHIELRQDADKMEQMAFVFCNAWLLLTDARVKNTNAVLVA